jgi:hypothetical protein
MRTSLEARARLSAALRDPLVWRRTLVLGLPVGLLQVAINQGDHWVHQTVDRVVILKTVLSPFLSCSIAFLSTAAARRHAPSTTSSS